MPSSNYSISTPENVDLHLELAGFGNRILACLVDSLLSLAAILLVVALLALVNLVVSLSPLPSSSRNLVTGLSIMLGILTSFAILFGYYIFFEGIWQGQTPGKNLAHIRVIERNGQPVSWPAVLIRNFVRVLDQYVLLLGVICMIIDKNERRFGDIAAGTIVIKERLSEFSTQNIVLEFPVNQHDTLDIGRVSPQEYDLLVSYLRRRQKISQTQRPIIAKQLEDHFRLKLSEPDPSEQSAEAFLERIFSLYQARAAN
jgi:uncharacterized RDD family membrane protein YckC